MEASQKRWRLRRKRCKEREMKKYKHVSKQRRSLNKLSSKIIKNKHSIVSLNGGGSAAAKNSDRAWFENGGEAVNFQKSNAKNKKRFLKTLQNHNASKRRKPNKKSKNSETSKLKLKVERNRVNRTSSNANDGYEKEDVEKNPTQK